MHKSIKANTKQYILLNQLIYLVYLVSKKPKPSHLWFQVEQQIKILEEFWNDPHQSLKENIMRVLWWANTTQILYLMHESWMCSLKNGRIQQTCFVLSDVLFYLSHFGIIYFLKKKKKSQNPPTKPHEKQQTKIHQTNKTKILTPSQKSVFPWHIGIVIWPIYC